MLPVVFPPGFSRDGLARIPFVCVQEGGGRQVSNTAHSQQVTFPILPFLEPVNHSGSSGCGEGKVIRISQSEDSLMVALSSTFNFYLNVLYKTPPTSRSGELIRSQRRQTSIFLLFLYRKLALYLLVGYTSVPWLI